MIHRRKKCKQVEKKIPENVDHQLIAGQHNRHVDNYSYALFDPGECAEKISCLDGNDKTYHIMTISNQPQGNKHVLDAAHVYDRFGNTSAVDYDRVYFRKGVNC